MENIDSELLLNYYFKDGFLFYCPDRLIWNTVKEDLENFDIEALEDGFIDER